MTEPRRIFDGAQSVDKDGFCFGGGTKTHNKIDFESFLRILKVLFLEKAPYVGRGAKPHILFRHSEPRRIFGGAFGCYSGIRVPSLAGVPSISREFHLSIEQRSQLFPRHGGAERLGHALDIRDKRMRFPLGIVLT